MTIRLRELKLAKLVSNIKHERHAYISDHDIIIVKVDLEITEEDKCEKKNFCFTDIPL